MMRRFINYIIYRNSIAFSFFRNYYYYSSLLFLLLFITAVGSIWICSIVTSKEFVNTETVVNTFYKSNAKRTVSQNKFQPQSD